MSSARIKEAHLTKSSEAARPKAHLMKWKELRAKPKKRNHGASSRSLERLVRSAAFRLQELYDAQHGNADLHDPDPGDKVNVALLKLVKRCRNLRSTSNEKIRDRDDNVLSPTQKAK